MSETGNPTLQQIIAQNDEQSRRIHDLEVGSKERNDLLIRIDERTSKMAQTMERIENNHVTKEELQDVKDNYVRIESFEPVKKVVYGLVSVILIGVIGLVLKVTL